MANFFEGVGNLLKHPIDEVKWMWDETKNIGKPLLKGDLGESFDQFKGSFGRHNEMMEDITVPLGGRNKLTENPDAAAGAVLGSIFAAPAIGGMFGGGGSAGGGGFGGFGTEGAFGNYFKPTSITKPGLGSEGVGWGGGANLDFGLPTDYAGMKDAATAKAGGFDFEGLARTLQSIKPVDATPNINMSSGRVGGGGARFDSKQYENPLLTREYNALYSQPLYTPLS